MQSTAIMAAAAAAAAAASVDTSLLEPWSYSCWTSDAFARDTETLTRALQASLSSPADNYYSSSSASPSPVVTPTAAAIKRDAVFSDSSDSGSRLTSRGNTGAPSRLPGCAAGKISKRKSRASKKSPTTFITADPANFREMVQQVTGVRFAADTGVPPGLDSRVLMRPEPQRLGGAARPAAAVLPQNCFLPTLDTSAFLLDREFPAGSPLGSVGTAPGLSADRVSGGGVGGGSGGRVFELEQPFSCFPTLESWGVM